MSNKVLSNLDLCYINFTYSSYSYFGPRFISLNLTTRVSFLSFVLVSFPCSYLILSPGFEWLVDSFYSGFNLNTFYSERLFLNTPFKRVSPCHLIFLCLFCFLKQLFYLSNNSNSNPCSPILLPSMLYAQGKLDDCH